MSHRRPTALRPRLALAALGLLLAASAGAHSFGAQFPSARYAVRADAEALWVVVVVEIPALDVLGDFRRFRRDHAELSDAEQVEQFRLAQLERLADGLALEVDGEAVPEAFSPLENEANGKGTAEFFIYMLEHRRPLAEDDERLELRLENEMLGAKVLYMASHAEARGPWTLAADSAAPILAAGQMGEIVGPTLDDDPYGMWSTDEDLRTLRLVFTREP